MEYSLAKPKFVLSGICRIGDVGEPTTLKDYTDKDLFVGDIVIVSAVDSFGICNNTGLSVICSDKWTTFHDNTHIQKSGEIEHFVMGIRSIDFMKKDSDKWIVKKVKSFDNVICGEHWDDFGFKYVSE